MTVPKMVRDALGLRQGDQLCWELEDGSVRVPFAFADRQAQKRRPALVLSQPGFQQACGHVLLAAGLPKPCVVR
ncbi:type II toxin-antitoxin system PrlF family antitoxin [Cyanobium sp. NS01]|uniref:type II toxin-antitoxin system PrlF family antitoxin n=1 Tax=Cyanobium sp. NS01 TaxID=261284 RepID=UPI001CA3D6A5|nr:type II toxin-antitoxin system PrlF family antitoxin [Cyanobium sp. NS01]